MRRSKIRRCSLRENEVHIWWIPLTRPPGEVERMRRLLPDEEKARLERRLDPTQQERLTVAWGKAREILASYLDRPPDKVCVRREANGKPILGGKVGSKLTFSLSHSHTVALVAVAPRLGLGVDVERVRENVDVMHLAKRFFSIEEARALASLPAGERASAFFRTWVRKEALIKGLGLGVPSALPKVSIEVDAVDTHRILIPLEEGGDEGTTWTVCDLDVLSLGYAAAVAVEHSEPLISFHVVAAAHLVCDGKKRRRRQRTS